MLYGYKTLYGLLLGLYLLTLGLHSFHTRRQMMVGFMTIKQRQNACSIHYVL